MTDTAALPHTAAAVLAGLRADRSARDAAEARLLAGAVAWAALHRTDDVDLALTFGCTPVTVAGPGAPLIAFDAVAEFAAVMGLPTETGSALLGEAVELAHRLPLTYARVLDGDLTAWRARRIARTTLLLSAEAASFVDRQIAPFAHQVRPVQVDRLVEAAIARFMPEEARRRRLDAAERRYLTIEHDQVSVDGTSLLHGELDLADALDLDAAVSHGAAQLAACGSSESLDARRAIALGELARRQLALAVELDVETGEERPTPRRPVSLSLHVSELALHGCTCGAGLLARLDRGPRIITTERARDLCRGAEVILRPMIDLDEHRHSDAYEVPPLLREQIEQRTPSCVFPWCTRPAARADCDHVQEHGRDGPTCSCNLAPLCRTHHRLKTHTAWTYVVLDATTHLWTTRPGCTCVATVTAPPRSLPVDHRTDASRRPRQAGLWSCPLSAPPRSRGTSRTPAPAALQRRCR